MRKTLSEIKMLGRDELTLTGEVDSHGEAHSLEIHAIGCKPLLEQIQSLRATMTGVSLKDLPIPQGGSHPELLIRELICRAQGKWHPPYIDEEICHCRSVPAVRVFDAIRAGCTTNQQVSELTSASTACGTCGPDVRALIDYYHQT